MRRQRFAFLFAPALLTASCTSDSPQTATLTQPSFVSLEGFVDALVVADGLRKAGADVTREKFVDALESLHDVDIGLGADAKLMFSAHHHQGIDHVYPTMIQNGKPQMITDWQAVVKH